MENFRALLVKLLPVGINTKQMTQGTSLRCLQNILEEILNDLLDIDLH